jgi:predicted Zn-dependent protease
MKVSAIRPLALCALLSACAQAPKDPAPEIVAPAPVSDLYSGIEMRMTVAAARDAANRCVESECDLREDFEQRVARLGAELSAAAAAQYPELAARVAHFEFQIADKAEPATASSGDGKVMVFRPVSDFASRDAALAFVLAREMGHVIARHHDKNTGVGIAASVLVTVLFPVLGITRLLTDIGPVAAVGAAGATGGANASFSTAGSVAASRAVIAAYRPQQLQEADAVALKLLASLGYDTKAIASAFDLAELRTPDSSWMNALRQSVEKLSAPGGAPTVEAQTGS